MKKLIITSLFLIVTSSFYFGQNIDFIVKTSPTLYITHFDTSTIKKNQKLVHLKHSSSKIESPKKLNFVTNKVIYSIALIYTESDKKQFDQEKLNRKRLTELKKHRPELINNGLISWQFIEQKDTHSDRNKGYFHGYLITLRPEIVGKDGETEFDILKGLVEANITLCKDSLGKSAEERAIIDDSIAKNTKHSYNNQPKYIGGMDALKKYLLKSIPYSKSMIKDNVSGELNVTFYIDEYGKLSKIKMSDDLTKECQSNVAYALKKMIKWLPGIIHIPEKINRPARQKLIGGIYRMSLFFSLETNLVYIKHINNLGPYYNENITQSLNDYYFPPEVICDNTVFNSLERNKHWKKMSIVADLTCSMMPYTNQLILWFKLNTLDERIKYLTFFNDGNGMLSTLKKPGKVGGIYQAEAKTYDDLLDLAEQTMFCCSGDIIENNIEAAIAAKDKYPNSEELIMIADNFATPRDLKLLRKVKKPIRLILCGTYYGINVDYLNMIKKNGGSIHTMEEDLTIITTLKEGEILDFSGRRFKVINGQFEEVYDL
ncbi:MAG: hypothetical protein HRT73_01600 [Flavobacteriales bacterium]|nr:hypothetical protein [Flavobacteriales bacterium]